MPTFRMRSSVSKISGRSSSGMPMMSPMTDIGSTSATSSIQSPPPAASSPSIIAAARVRMPSSSLPIAFGVKACDITRRRLVSSGGSMLMMVGDRSDDADALDERAVDGGERVGVAVDALGVPVLGRHPEVTFDRLGDTVGELVVEDRPLAAEFGEQIVGKTVPPQRRIRQIDRRRRGHAGSWFGRP